MNSDNLTPMGYMYAYGNGLMFLRLVSFLLQCNYTQDNELKEGTLFGLFSLWYLRHIALGLWEVVQYIIAYYS